MARVKVNCYEIPIELGNHILYLISTKSEKAATNYIKRKFGIEVLPLKEESGAYFVGYEHMLLIFLPPDAELHMLVHELEHVYEYMTSRMSTTQDEEGRAYIKQMLFRKSVEKLIEVNLVKITYSE